MNFPLAGLLRIRDAQERVAAEQLSRTTSARLQAEAAEQGAVVSLAEISAHVDDASTLLAMAAARAAGRSALSDLQNLAELRRAEETEAKATHVEARRELRGLERLEGAHQTESLRVERHAEQTALDEIAVVRSLREERTA
jgi:flagellar biosynthesis chaperone FliJ